MLGKPSSMRAGTMRYSALLPTPQTRTSAQQTATIRFSPRPSRTDSTRTPGNRLFSSGAGVGDSPGFLLSLQYLNGKDLSGGLVGYLSTLEFRPSVRKQLWLIRVLSSRCRHPCHILGYQRKLQRCPQYRLQQWEIQRDQQWVLEQWYHFIHQRNLQR